MAEEPEYLVEQVTRTTTVVTPLSSTPPKSNGINKKSLGFGIGGVVLLCVLGVCLWSNNPFGGKSSDNNAQSSSSQSGTASGGGADTGDGKQSGTLVATYTVTINHGSVPLGDAAPTQDQNDATCKSGDICVDGNFSSFDPLGGAKAYILSNHVPPTYSGCKSATQTASRVPIQVGQTFCVVKQGRVAGVSITSNSHTAGGPVTFTATVWADWPGSKPIVPSTAAGPAPGTQLASYSVTMNTGSVLLADTPPNGFDPNCESGTVCSDLNFSTLDPIGIAIKGYSLANNAAPTYDGCKATMVTITRIPIKVGQTFCLLWPGRVVGGTITANSKVAGGAFSFNVTVWADALPSS